LETIKNSVNFVNYSKDLGFSLEKKSKISEWIKKVIMQEEKELGEINYVFCSDNDLLNYNEKYLNHDDLTDVITFDYCDKNIISGDILISIERVTENSKIYSINTNNEIFNNELNRVMIHGLLHLIGFNDKTEEDMKAMRNKEDECLFLLID